MSDEKRLRPGDPAPAVGLYAVVDSDGNVTEVIYRIKKKGKPLPPTFRKKQWFKKVG